MAFTDREPITSANSMRACPRGSASARHAFLRASRPRRRSTSFANAATRRARSTSRAASGWTTRSRSASASSPGSTTSRSRCTRRSSGSWATWRRAGASSPPRWERSTAAPASPPRRGAELVVFHPGFLLGRSREDALDAVVEQLGTLRERLEGKDRAVTFGVEVMGRVRDLGSLDDVVEISRQDDVGAARARLRTHARDERRSVSRRRAVHRGVARRRRGSRPRSAVPHPLLRHRLREPQRDQAPSLRRRDASCRSACATRSTRSSARRR